MKKLLRSRSQRMLGGVLGGIAEYFEVDVTVIRLLFVMIAIFTAIFPALILYIAALFIIPEGY